MEVVNDHGLKRSIPNNIKLQVRKHCGFGCIICGAWICEYEHFDPEFKDALIHDPNGIALLCGTHHDAKSKGLISNEQVRRYWNNPYNTRNDIRNNELFFDSIPKLVLCGNEVIDGGAIYANLKFTSPFFETNKSTGKKSLKNELVIKIFEIGNPSSSEPIPFYLAFYDSVEHLNPILEIENNEWHGSINNFDIESIGKKLIVRKKQGKILISVEFDSENNSINIENIDITLPGIKINRFLNSMSKEYGINLNGLKVTKSVIEGNVSLIGILRNHFGQFEVCKE